jgi:hypothetical protein
MTEHFSYLIEKINYDELAEFEYYEDDIPSVSLTFTDRELHIPSDDIILKTDDMGFIVNKSISKYILIKLINGINLKNT